MLLTVPWSASLFMAACDFDEFGEVIERRRTSWNFFRTGITVDHVSFLLLLRCVCSLVNKWL